MARQQKPSHAIESSKGAQGKPLPKVTLLFETFPNVTEPYLVSVAEGLARKGMVKAVFSARPAGVPKGQRLPVSDQLKRKINYLPVSPVYYLLRGRFLFDLLRGLLFNPRALFSLARAAKRLRRSRTGQLFSFAALLPMVPYLRGVLHIMASAPARSFPELFELPGIKVVASFRGYEIAVRPLFDAGWIDYLQNTVFQKAARLHFVSRFLCEAGKSFGAPSNKCVVPRQSISDIFFEAKRAPAGPVPLLVSVGRLVWIKGFEYAVEAAQILKMRGRRFQYVIIGDGSWRPYLHYLIYHRGLQDEVMLLGAAPPETVRARLSEASVFVCPSVSPSESLGRQLMEAQAVGVAIVATSVGGIPECVEDGKTAFCVPPFEPGLIAEKIELLLDNPELAARMGEAGRERAKRLFRVENELSDWAELYGNLSFER